MSIPDCTVGQIPTYEKDNTPSCNLPICPQGQEPTLIDSIPKHYRECRKPKAEEYYAAVAENERLKVELSKLKEDTVTIDKAAYEKLIATQKLHDDVLGFAYDLFRKSIPSSVGIYHAYEARPRVLATSLTKYFATGLRPAMLGGFGGAVMNGALTYSTKKHEWLSGIIDSNQYAFDIVSNAAAGFISATFASSAYSTAIAGAAAASMAPAGVALGIGAALAIGLISSYGLDYLGQQIGEEVVLGYKTQTQIDEEWEKVPRHVAN